MTVEMNTAHDVISGLQDLAKSARDTAWEIEKASGIYEMLTSSYFDIDAGYLTRELETNVYLDGDLVGDLVSERCGR